MRSQNIFIKQALVANTAYTTLSVTLNNSIPFNVKRIVSKLIVQYNTIEKYVTVVADDDFEADVIYVKCSELGTNILAHSVVNTGSNEVETIFDSPVSIADRELTLSLSSTDSNFTSERAGMFSLILTLYDN